MRRVLLCVLRRVRGRGAALHIRVLEQVQHEVGLAAREVVAAGRPAYLTAARQRVRHALRGHGHGGVTVLAHRHRRLFVLLRCKQEMALLMHVCL